MTIEVEVISRETIRPSSPILPHHKTFKLSFLDQLAHPNYVPVILFYPKSYVDLNQTLTRLKNSLSETLAEFYPLAGRFNNDDLSIDHDDGGVLYIEARANCSMSEILNEPKHDILHMLVPHQHLLIQPNTLAVLVVIQVNIFTCGGIAICVSFLHKTLDAASVSYFVNAWASIASCSSPKVVSPNFVAASSLFPPTDLSATRPSIIPTSFFKEVKPVTNRFVFDATAISKLKARATGPCVTNPSRVQTVTGFIWNRSMVASRQISGSRRTSVVRHAVNLRPLLQSSEPSLPANSMGNLVSVVYTDPATSDAELHSLVALLRDAIGTYNGDYLKTLQGNEGFFLFREFIQDLKNRFVKEEMDAYGFSSWCNLGFDRVDFGWGKPIWITVDLEQRRLTFSIPNLCVLIDRVEGGGVEALLSFEEKVMAILESDPEFLEYASPNPSVI